MKIKKSSILKILITICIAFLAISIMNSSHAVIGAIAGIAGFGVLLVWAGQIAAVGIALALKGIMFAVTGFMSGDSTGVVSMAQIFFNRNGATTAAFFGGVGIANKVETASVVNTICVHVEKWYYIIRNLSIAALLFILLYIGIRMAISTVADKEAKYKKMLVDWTVSLVLVFVLHYIMVITFYINNTIVSALYTVYEANAPSFWGDWFLLYVSVLIPIEGLDEAIVICSIMVSEFLFFIVYVKRFITLSFLIIIAPLITVTYSIDKLGDGKSQALNTWLKEFIFTVIIQPVHCILYLILVLPVIENVSGAGAALGSGVFYIIMLNFIRNAETIIKKIFNIRADSMPDTSTTAALTFGVMSGLLGKFGKGAKSDDKTGRTMPKMSEEAGAEKAKDTATKTDLKGDKETKDADSTGRDKSETAESTSEGPKSEDGETDKSPIDEAIDETKDSSYDGEGPVYPVEPVEGPVYPITDGSVPKKRKIRNGIRGIGAKIGGSDFGREFKRTMSYLTNYDKGGGSAAAKTIMKKGLSAGGAIFGASAGLALGDASKAIALGAAGAAGMNKIESAISDVQDNTGLRENQRFFAGAVNDYAYAAQAYSDRDLSASEIRQKAIELWQNYQDGAIDLDSDDIEDYQRDFLEKCDQMNDTYSYLGVDDSAAAVNQTIGMALTGEIKEHKDYRSKYEERRSAKDK